LTLEESIRAFTALPAWSSKKEKFLGAITPGRLADLTVFAQDLFQVPPEAWPSVEIEMTVVDGEIVYRKEK
jgi:predicted amidohydrolase YtcJ